MDTVHDQETENPETQDRPELDELAARYLADVAEAIEATQGSRPELLTLKLHFAGVVALIELTAALRETELDDDETAGYAEHGGPDPR